MLQGRHPNVAVYLPIPTDREDEFINWLGGDVDVELDYSKVEFKHIQKQGEMFLTMFNCDPCSAQRTLMIPGFYSQLWEGSVVSCLRVGDWESDPAISILCNSLCGKSFNLS